MVSIRKPSVLVAAGELLASMRFAVSLLTVIAIASVIGTVLRQNEPYPNYVAQFGAFWFPVFDVLGLYDVYHATWFLVILAFLVVSTSVCVWRNAPVMLRQAQGYAERMTADSLAALPEHARLPVAFDTDEAAGRAQRLLEAAGYRVRTSRRKDGSRLVAAKAGTWNRAGYVLAHVAIVLICVGALLDGNLGLKLALLAGGKRVETRDLRASEVPAASRLGPGNLSYRGNVSVPEGAATDAVFVNLGDGYLVQELPFTLELKRFHIEHYSTGQPRDFASDVVVRDHATGTSFAHTVRVNQPLVYRGVAIYQASFEDGGTRLSLAAWPLAGRGVRPEAFDGVVKQALRVPAGGGELALEFTDFRPFNVENLADNAGSRVEAASVPGKVLSRLGSSAPDERGRDLRNVGPSFQWKLRDASGSAREYVTYMLPIPLDGRWYFVSGMRVSPDDGFRYLRIPADASGKLDGYARLRDALLDPANRRELGRRFARTAGQGSALGETARQQLADSAERVVEIFSTGGFRALAEFIDKAVPEAERRRAAEIYARILDGAALEAWQIAQGRGREADDAQLAFVRDALAAMSEAFDYGAPVFLQLTAFDQREASGFQLTRSPGRTIVYGGFVLLVLGVFAMFYIRERRAWVLLKSPEAQFAMAASRRTLDLEAEFSGLRRRLEETLQPPAA